MKFNPLNFRTLADDLTNLGIRINSESPMILVKSTGEIEFAKGRLDKDRLVAAFNEKKDVLLWAWRGQYSTDMFKLSAEDIKKHYK